MAVTLANRIRVRARSCCEYCGAAEAWEPFFVYHVEHIVACQHRGSDALENLAFACNHCNLHKGTNLTSIDPDSGSLSLLFNPLAHHWAEHFQNEGERIAGITVIGRTTVFLLQMNAPHRAGLRYENLEDV